MKVPMEIFVPFDPLENKVSADAAFGSLKRELENILSSYTGWFDPFCELIQNALDAVEARQLLENSAGTSDSYHPTVDIFIDVKDNLLTVTDNGIGLDQEKFKQFLAPASSFKVGNTRGHKGVGATYVAYGFNYMRISTKMPGFVASGRISGARTWLKSTVSAGNPKIEPDDSVLAEKAFEENDRGVSITVRFDSTTHPKSLVWLNATTADQWADILSIKTGIGAIIANNDIKINIKVADKSGVVSQRTLQGIKYFWLHDRPCKKSSYKTLKRVSEERFAQYGAKFRMPDQYRNLDFIYETWTAAELKGLLGDEINDDDREVIDNHSPTISVEYSSTVKLYNQYNESLKIRSGYKILQSGIQLAANNMPQGEVFIVPLNRNIGRQNQVHFLVHFDSYTPDLGRKGFHRDLSDFAKTAARILMEKHLFKQRDALKANTGISPDLVRELSIDDWKDEMLNHEKRDPLVIASPHFFKPVDRISITSVPTREQDVIALFHELVAGGVIRGLSIMSTNERFVYDGLFKIAFDLDEQIYIYEEEKNPLGVSLGVAQEFAGKVSRPKVLEYKFSLDGLIEDFDGLDKNIRDVDLCICWNTGELYKSKYGITSLLVPENADQRQYHGLTHVLCDIENGAKYCGIIVLEELVSHLKNPETSAEFQRQKYD